MNIAIVDDEKIFLDTLVKKLDLEGHDVYTFTSIVDLEESNRVYELLLLDIEMPDYDGINYSKEHPEQRVIFITNHSTRMKEAFMRNVYGFIEKIDDIRTINKCIKSVILDIQSQEIIRIKNNTDYYEFTIDDIAYIQYIGNKTLGIVYHKQNLLIYGYTLKELSQLLGPGFIYIDRNVIVNLSMITHYIDNRIYIRDIKETFEVSVRRRKLLKDLLMKSKKV